MKRVLIIANHRKDRSPGQRFRFEQYLSYLSSQGYTFEFSYLISEKEDYVFYNNGRWFKKAIIVFKSFVKRFLEVRKANSFDIIFIYREAFFTGTTYFEKKISKSNAKFIFDFDDSIWLSNVSKANEKFEWLKKYNKTKKIISLACMVFTGNQYLADYALQVNKNVKIIPTTIDTDEYHKFYIGKNEFLIIGWSGSITTIQHFEYALPFLKKIKSKYKKKVQIKVIGDGNYENLDLEIKGINWNKNDEIKELSTFDIGIMPLPNDEWAKGKCGLKGLQYMALEIPTLMSPVGVNKEIIEDGVNGFLPKDNDDWFNKISLLIEDGELRDKLGKNGRKTVIEKYSVKAWKDKYLQHFNDLTLADKKER